jgi:Zn-finger nucleic acid-binding protein
MATVNYGETNVMVDTCPNCEGIWLDKGEFKQIVQALEDEITSLTADDYRSAALKQAKEIVTGPESMISEWRDFRTVFRLMQYRMMVENPKLQNTLLNMQRESPFK